MRAARALIACAWASAVALPAGAEPASSPALTSEAGAPVELALVSVVIAGPELDARAVEQAVARATARRRGVRVVLAADVGSLEGSQMRDCGPDTQCLGAVLGETTVPLALMVVVNARVTPPVVAVRVVAAGRAGEVRAEQVSALPAGEAGDRRTAELTEGIERATAAVLERLGHPSWARIEVRARPETAVVQVVDPVLAEARAGNVLWLPPGTARVRVEAPGHVAAELSLEVRSGEDRTEEVTLAIDDPWWHSPWFWSAVGVGVAAGVVGTVLALPGGDRCACVGHPASACGCP